MLANGADSADWCVARTLHCLWGLYYTPTMLCCRHRVRHQPLLGLGSFSRCTPDRPIFSFIAVRGPVAQDQPPTSFINPSHHQLLRHSGSTRGSRRSPPSPRSRSARRSPHPPVPDPHAHHAMQAQRAVTIRSASSHRSMSKNQDPPPLRATIRLTDFPHLTNRADAVHPAWNSEPVRIDFFTIGATAREERGFRISFCLRPCSARHLLLFLGLALRFGLGFLFLFYTHICSTIAKFVGRLLWIISAKERSTLCFGFSRSPPISAA